MWPNRYGMLKNKKYVIVQGVVFIASHIEKNLKGWIIYPFCGHQELPIQNITNKEVADAFVKKYNGKCIKNRWYPAV